MMVSKYFRSVALVSTFASMVAFSGAAAAASEVKEQPDGSWVSMTGTVVSQQPDQFTLDYGEGSVVVEMDDWDLEADGWAVANGDSVTVYGRADKDLYEKSRIEADSVYVDDLNTLLSEPESSDEETFSPVDYSFYQSPDDFDLHYTGTVTSVDDREFTIDAGDRKVRIDTTLMDYNPTDDQGYQQIDKGDFVSVSGDLDLDYFEKREIDAESITSYE